jgi:DNA-binding protein H-NS
MPVADILDSIRATADKDDLKEIIAAARSRLEAVITEERKAITAKIAELAASVDLDVVIQEKPAVGKKSKRKKDAPTTLPPKYRNPDNPADTWHGHGRRPNWLKDLVAADRDKEEFLIES